MSTQKIKLKDLIEWLVVEFNEIENSDIPQHKKTKKFQSLASVFINKLYGDGRKRADSKITLSTARGYLTKVRKAISEVSGIHHRFESELSRLTKKYPSHSGFLLGLSGLEPTEARIAKKNLLDALTASHELMEKVDLLDFSKSLTRKLKKLADEYPEYKNLIVGLGDKNNAMAAKTTLIKAVNEAKPLFGELKTLKVDHELIVNLVLPHADKAVLSNKAKSSLNKKKTTVVYVDYPAYMERILSILSHPDASFNGLVSGIAPLVFALCAATGRRPIEILKTGSFKAKGKHQLLFSGQAKKRTDEEAEQSNLIYCLVNNDVFLNAFDVLRNHAITRKIIAESEGEDHRTDNEVIKGKVAPHLSAFAKDFFVDKRRVPKDTRGIYGRICYQKHYLNDPRWRDKDEDIFFYELFVHNDTNAQAHYKPYKLNNFIDDYEPAVTINERWQELCNLDDIMEGLARGDAAVKIHTWVKHEVERNPFIEINQSMLTRETGVYRGTIKNYLAAIGDLASPGEPLSVQHEEEIDDEPVEQAKSAVKKAEVKEKPQTKKAKKPHVKAHDLNGDKWKVSVTLGNKTSMFTINAGDKITAMKTGYALFVGELFEFKVTIPYKSGPHFQDTIYAKNEKSAEGIALNDAGLDGFKGAYNKIQVKKL